MRIIGKYTLAVLICLMLLTGAALASGFSADIVSVAEGERMTGKMYAGMNKMRFETSEMITITRMDKGVIWMIMPEEKMYMEQKLPTGTVIPTKEPAQNEIERILIGTESFDGKAVDKYQVTMTDGGKKVSHYQWIAKDSGFPLKMAAMDGSWQQEYRNLSFAEPPAVLFELPAGYQKLQMPF